MATPTDRAGTHQRTFLAVNCTTVTKQRVGRTERSDLRRMFVVRRGVPSYAFVESVYPV
jgi:hypothetical protein